MTMYNSIQITTPRKRNRNGEGGGGGGGGGGGNQPLLPHGNQRGLAP